MRAQMLVDETSVRPSLARNVNPADERDLAGGVAVRRAAQSTYPLTPRLGLCADSCHNGRAFDAPGDVSVPDKVLVRTGTVALGLAMALVRRLRAEADDVLHDPSLSSALTAPSPFSGLYAGVSFGLMNANRQVFYPDVNGYRVPAGVVRRLSIRCCAGMTAGRRGSVRRRLPAATTGSVGTTPSPSAGSAS